MNSLLWCGAIFAGFIVRGAIGFAYSERWRAIHLASLKAAQLENVGLRKGIEDLRRSYDALQTMIRMRTAENEGRTTHDREDQTPGPSEG